MRGITSAVALSVLLTVGGASVRAAAAQQPAGVGASRCDPWYDPPGFPGGDERSRTPCSLARRPRPVIDTLAARLPQATPGYSAQLRLKVQSDGTVDSLRTQMWTASGWGATVAGFSVEGAAMTALRSVRFSPGTAGDTVVRTAINLEISVPEGPDTVPATARWRYVVGAETDTFRLDWTLQRALGPPPPVEAAEVLLVTMAELRVMRTYGRSLVWRGCFDLDVALPGREAVARALTAAGAASVLAPD